MRSCRLRLALVASTVLLAIPGVATASPFMMEWNVLGPGPDTHVYSHAGISGGTIIWAQHGPGEPDVIQRFDLASATSSLFMALPNNGYVQETHISGDWVVWETVDQDVGAKNLKSGVVKHVTSDAYSKRDRYPAVSTTDGSYIVWSQADGADGSKIVGKNLAINGSVFKVATGTTDQTAPSIFGKRVAYLDDSNGHANVRVKTIGSSAQPLKITDNGSEQSEPNIGSHLAAWRVQNASGKWMIRYYDFNTGLTYDGPTSTVFDVYTPLVSGDRILYSVSVGGWNTFVWDTRIAKATPTKASFEVAATDEYEVGTGMDGNNIVYLSGDGIRFARLAVPSIKLNSVPSRIARGGHIHIAGSISDLGQRISGARIGIEKYASGKWTQVWSTAADANGVFSYKTPKTYSKTKYRAIYDGHVTISGAPWTNHLSTVSVVKTAWPR